MTTNELNPTVGLAWTDPSYPQPPYQRDSHIARALLAVFRALGLPDTRPLQGLIKPGQTALIKPNWVRDINPNGHDLASLITHPALIAALIDTVAEAMEGRGTIVIGDAPLQNCNFPRLLERSGMNVLVDDYRQRYPQLNITVEDWRLTTMNRMNYTAGWDKRSPQASRDDFGQRGVSSHHVVDVGGKSFLEDIAEYADRFRVTKYKPSLMRRHHAPGKHEYLVANRVFDVDLLLNVSKMKTHIKAGITGALKSLIGINGHKEYLPHHIKGSYVSGGDNYIMPSRLRTRYENRYDEYWEHFSTLTPFQRKALGLELRFLDRLAHLIGPDRSNAGSWRGNETVWRTTLDLNHLLYFWHDRRPKHILNIVDGIVAGQGEGPLTPTPKPVGLLIGGANPAYVDAVMAKLVGYNLSRIPTVYHAIYHRRSQFAGPYLEATSVPSTDLRTDTVSTVRFNELPNLGFVKPRYWRGA